MIRLIQFFEATGDRAVGVIGDKAGVLRVVDGYASVYELALAAICAQETLASFVQSRLSGMLVDYDGVIAEQRLLPPLDHPDPARCLVSLTGLTHLGSARSHDQMHAALQSGVPPIRCGCSKSALMAANPLRGRSALSLSGRIRVTAASISSVPTA